MVVTLSYDIMTNITTLHVRLVQRQSSDITCNMTLWYSCCKSKTYLYMLTLFYSHRRCAVADPKGAKRPCTSPPNSWPSEEKLWELLSSWLSVSTLAMIKFVTYSLPGKIIFSTIFCRNSSAFDWATVSLECQTGQAYCMEVRAVQKQTLRWTR